MTNDKTLTLGTRGSALALTQSAMVREALERSGHTVQVEVIQTTGDRDQATALSRIGGKGLFTRELDVALLEGRIDFAEMTRVFNLGLGWVFVTSDADAETVRLLAPDALPVGRVTSARDRGPRVQLLGAP